MIFNSGQDYSIECSLDVAESDSVLKDIVDTANRLSGQQKVEYLSQLILKIKSGKLNSSLVFVDGRFDEIKFSSIETLLSYILFQRGAENCYRCVENNSFRWINEAFLDFNYAIHYSLTPEMLGICSLFRAYYCPKTEEETVNDFFIVNEYNIAKKTLGAKSPTFIKFVEDFSADDRNPDVLYYFLSKDTESDIYYFQHVSIGNLQTFKPLNSINPYLCVHNDRILSKNLGALYSRDDFDFLSSLELDKDLFKIT